MSSSWLCGCGGRKPPPPWALPLRPRATATTAPCCGCRPPQQQPRLPRPPPPPSCPPPPRVWRGRRRRRCRGSGSGRNRPLHGRCRDARGLPPIPCPAVAAACAVSCHGCRARRYHRGARYLPRLAPLPSPPPPWQQQRPRTTALASLFVRYRHGCCCYGSHL